MKIKILLLVSISLLTTGCKKDIEQPEPVKPLEKITVTGELTENTLTQEFVCGERTFLFQFPLFSGSADAVKRLEQDILPLLVADFVDITYKEGTPTKEVYELFVSQRKAKLCSNPNNGMQEMVVKHVSENEDFVSYEIAYVKDNVASSTIHSYRKNGMTPVYLQELIKPGKEQDVQTIYDINLQSEVAALALIVRPEDQHFFQSFIKDKVYNFKPGSFKTLNPGLRKDANDNIYLQVAKQIELPARLSYINNMVVLDIAAEELSAYLDFSKVK